MERQGTGIRLVTEDAEGAHFAPIEDAIAAIARGEIVIVVDDPKRENEGDFVMAADLVTPEAVNFMVTFGRGLVCLPMEGPQLDRLGLRQMVDSDPTARYGTAFTVSIDISEPPNTGISAHDRARCITRAVAHDAAPGEFRAPGHIFPLRARPGGVLERAGHTEAAVDLARLAGRTAAGAICEILNEDGSMARVPDLVEVAKRHNLLMITIEDLIAYRQRGETLIQRASQATIPTAYGEFTAICFRSAVDGEQHLAFTYGDVEGADGLLVRVHSECLTGDVFGSMRCDCGAQLNEAMRRIAMEGRGVVVYLRGHEGRGIGIEHKLHAYTLQDAGADTVEANVLLGFPADARTYEVAAQILRALDVDNLRLLTNNPAKRTGLEDHGVAVTTRVPLETVPTSQNIRYLQSKRDRLAHELSLVEELTLSAE